ncbi:chemotaxis response regulator protein-glutamate methylesterase [Thermodesulfobacteriota bacterium]
MPQRELIKIIVVDDSIVYRRLIKNILSELPDVDVVGFASNGREAIDKIKRLKPDLLILDIEMPEMNGLEVLATIKKENLNVRAIMLSGVTRSGGKLVMKTLEQGAFDFITKPDIEMSMVTNKLLLADAFKTKISAFIRHRNLRKIQRRPDNQAQTAQSNFQQSHAARQVPTIKRQSQSKIVAIGISTGGPEALAKVLPGIPSGFGAPIVIAQHMPPFFTEALAANLDPKCAITVKEAEDGEPVLPDTAYLAPGGKHMKIIPGSGGFNSFKIRVTDELLQYNYKPSVDYLFDSVAECYGERATGVIMTGMGSDGLQGLTNMKARGALVIAQDPESCVVFGMPKGPIEKGLVNVIAPLESIAAEIRRTVE